MGKKKKKGARPQKKAAAIPSEKSTRQQEEERAEDVAFRERRAAADAERRAAVSAEVAASKTLSKVGEAMAAQLSAASAREARLPGLGQPVGGVERGGEQQEVAVHVAGEVSSAEHCVHIATHLKAVVRFGGRKLDRAAVARHLRVHEAKLVAGMTSCPLGGRGKAGDAAHMDEHRQRCFAWDRCKLASSTCLDLFASTLPRNTRQTRPKTPHCK
jgi:hypothetical protein